jgi:hypothetical protein
MTISVNTKTEYTPEWNDNRDDASPVIVEHLTPTMALYNELIQPPTIKMKITTDGKMDGGETDLILDNKKIVRKMVTKIRNLTVEIDGKPINVTSGSDLFGPGMPPVIAGLVDELGTYLQGLLSDRSVNAKN